MSPEVVVTAAEPDASAVSRVRIAVAQLDSQVGLDRRAANAENAMAAARTAVAQGAQVIVLPELVTTGYSFADRAEAFAHAEPVPGPTTDAWAAFTAEHGCYVAVGLAERDGPRLFDTAVLLGPDGIVGTYRKTHLWNTEKLWFTPGDLGVPVFDTPIGRIGLLICWDIWFPEVARLLALQGADLICSLNDWVWTPPPLFDDNGRCMASYLTMTAAHVNSVVIAAADRIGEERRTAKFLGCSLIAGPNGWPIGPVADPTSEMLLLADVDLMTARTSKIWNDLNDLPRDRRVDLYDSMLGYRGAAAWPR